MKHQKKEQNIIIKNVITDTDYGFCSVHFEVLKGDKSAGEYTLQACLALKKPTPASLGAKQPEHKKEVNGVECGFDWGVCGEVNDAAIKEIGFDECWKIFKRGARASGVVIVNP